jgi:mRNA-degrading endonuclease RelE of RelBE toxin-antitoxin system
VRAVQIVYSPAARDLLRHFQPSLKAALREAIEELCSAPTKGKPLQEEFEGFRSLRFKRYRVIYRYVEGKRRIEILFAGPRRDVYGQFADYLKSLRK